MMPGTMPGRCRPLGESCGKNDECCGGERCGADADGRMRCLPAGDGCAANGFPCRVAAQCCGGFCLPDATAGFFCAGACAPTGAACRAARDCCAGSCVGPPGATVCVHGAADPEGPICTAGGDGCATGESGCCAGLAVRVGPGRRHRLRAVRPASSPPRRNKFPNRRARPVHRSGQGERDQPNLRLAAIGLAVAVGCSFAPDGANGSQPSGTPDLGNIGGAPAATGAGGRRDSTPGPASAAWADPEHPACAGALYHGQALPLDVYIMFDESGSMATMDDGVTMRMDAVRNAVSQFLADPDSAGISVGIGYFGTQPLSCACTSCNPNDYATPAVPLGLLPGAAPALVASLSKQAPTGETPTGAALRGACSYATSAKQARPDHAVVILLVTDGIPQAPLTTAAGGCNPTLADANAAAASCFSAATPIRTYVLGVGPSLANLNQIATAGGTGHAYLVESGGSAGVLAALGAIRQDAMIPCSLGIPHDVDRRRRRRLHRQHRLCRRRTVG